jgi:hypothetical protein
MLYTCYDYSCRYNKFCLIFIRDKDIINISVSYYYDDEECGLFLVMTEEMMKEYPALYKKYMISIMLTEDPSRLSGTENIYSIRKRTICENRYITKGYNSKNSWVYFFMHGDTIGIDDLLENFSKFIRFDVSGRFY